MPEENKDAKPEDGAAKTEDSKETFTIPDNSQPQTDQTKEAFTIEKAKELGWSEQEIKQAEEQKMFSAVGGKKPEENKQEEEEKKPGDQDQKTTDEEKQAKPKAESQKEKFKLSPEEEESFSKFFPKGHNVSGLFFELKHQRSRAQAAEQERAQLEERLAESSKKYDEIIKRLDAKDKGKDDLEEEEEERPLTRKELLATLAEIKDNESKQKEEYDKKVNESAQKIQKALTIQEDYARTQYEDFDQVTELGKKLLAVDPKTGEFVNEINVSNLPELKMKKAKTLIRKIREMATKADEIKPGEYNLADMAYELGTLHPDYGIPADGSHADNTSNGKTNRTDNGHLTPEDVKRIERNSMRGSSSASLSGSRGNRIVSIDDITVEHLNSMDSKTFDEFYRKYPDKVAKLQRG